MLTARTIIAIDWLLALWPHDSLSELWFGMGSFAILFLIVTLWRDAADCKIEQVKSSNRSWRPLHTLILVTALLAALAGIGWLAWHQFGGPTVITESHPAARASVPVAVATRRDLPVYPRRVTRYRLAVAEFLILAALDRGHGLLRAEWHGTRPLAGA